MNMVYSTGPLRNEVHVPSTCSVFTFTLLFYMFILKLNSWYHRQLGRPL